MSKSKLYDVWYQMKKRCYRKENSNYKYYGERGITVCDEWKKDYKAFKSWAIANGYKEGLTLDRINSNGNYEPSNCRWATIEEQARNMRINVFYTVGNETHTLSEWARIIGKSKSTVHDGLKRHGVSYIEKRFNEQ